MELPCLFKNIDKHVGVGTYCPTAKTITG